MKKILLCSLFFYSLIFSYAQNGSLDPTFGLKGIVKTDMGSPRNYNSSARQVLIHPDGSIYLILNDGIISKRLANGSIDSAYGFNGYSRSVYLSESFATLQTDGKIVIAGSVNNGTSFIVKRITANGAPDTLFGIKGVQTTDFNGNSFARSVALQSDGKIVVAGYTTDAANNTFFAVARYNNNGNPDNSFNGNGQLTSDFEFKIPPESGGDSIEIHNAYANMVLVQADGKIIVSGNAYTGTDNDFAIACYKVDGSPDSTFDNDGRQTSNFGAYDDFSYSLALQADGKIVIAGYTSDGTGNYFAVARFTVNGIPDNLFNGTGRQMVAIGSDIQIGNSLGIQSNGKILVAGYSLNGTYNDFSIIRLNTNGSPDETFDNDGMLTTDFISSDDYAGSIAIQPDNKFVVAGYSYIYSPNMDVQHIAVSRYNQDGNLDKSFADNGKLTGDFSQGYTRFNATAVQPDGKIVSAGQTWNGTDYDFAIARYNSNGSPDKSFSDDGIQITDFGDTDEAVSVVIQPDGKIIVTGNTGNQFAVARYSTNGSPDNGFDGDGKLIMAMGFADVARSAALQTDGKIVIAGYTFTDTNYDSAFFAVARLNSDGTRDLTFSEDGMQLTGFNGAPSFAAAVAIQKDGKIVVAGRTIINNQNNFALARYNNDGSADASFSQDGQVNSVFGPDDYTAQSLAIQNDGKIIVAGNSELNSGSNSLFAVARYLNDGERDLAFGDQGYVASNTGGNFNTGKSVAVNYDGRIAVAGTNDNFTIVLYKNDGSTDSSFGVNGIQTTNIGVKGSSIQSVVFSENKLVAAGSAQFPGTLGVMARYLLSEAGPLPVKLLDFKAALQNKSVFLQWQTTNEQNLSGYIVQRSNDGNHFNTIGWVAASGINGLKTNYSIIDRQPLTGINLYRLKMIDTDGRISYSKTVSVNLADEIFSWKVFPNPAKDILFMSTDGENNKATYQVFDAVGRKMKEATVLVNRNTPFSININGLPRGVYSLQIHTNAKTVTKRFIKE